MKTKAVAVVAVLALAGCTTIGPGGQMQRDATGNAIWSFLIPGVGQFMNGEAAKGVIMLGANVANNMYYQDSETVDEALDRQPTWLAIGLVVGVWSTADAYVSANRLNREQPLGRMFRAAEATSEPRFEPVVCLDLLNRRLLGSVSYRF